jgi:transaldolase
LTEGININITLLFSVERYEQVMEAYLTALEQRIFAKQPVHRIASVASFFVSRVDTAVDRIIDAKLKELPEGEERSRWAVLRGTIAIANAKVAYQRFKEVFTGPRWEHILNMDARVQRPLWASTGTKDPTFSDVYYVEPLIGPYTINTMPTATLAAFNDHGRVAETLEEGVDEARAHLAELAALGVNLTDITDQLEREGVASFSKSFEELMSGIEGKRSALSAAAAGRA